MSLTILPVLSLLPQSVVELLLKLLPLRQPLLERHVAEALAALAGGSTTRLSGEELGQLMGVRAGKEVGTGTRTGPPREARACGLAWARVVLVARRVTRCWLRSWWPAAAAAAAGLVHKDLRPSRS